MAGHHHHSHLSNTEMRKKGTRAVLIALVITLVFAATQLIGGFIANSLALMADALHMATDAASFCLTLFAFWVAKRPASPRMSFGYYRAEILGALISGAALWIICGFLIYEAVERIAHPPPVEGGIVFIIALITLIMNLVTMKILHGSSKDSLNVRAAYIHVLSDLLGNIGVIIAGAIIYLTGWYLADPILTIAFTALIIFSSGKMLWEAIEILMEAAPRSIKPREVILALTELPHIEEVHDLHVWTVSSGRIALSAHLVSYDPQASLEEAHKILDERFHIVHTTLQVEHPDRFETQYCFDCNDANS